MILVSVGIKLLTLLGRNVEAWATDFVTRHGIDLANRYVHAAMEKLSGVGDTQLMQMSGVAFGYSCLLFTEGVGLWLQKRWAEYLTAIATSLFMPLELYEIYERFTWVRIGILALNIFIVWYLVTRLKDEKKEILHKPAYRDTTYDGYEIKVKICGITNIEDARHAVDSGADQLGLNFYKESPRYVTPDKAREIVDALPIGTQTIGIFVNEPIEDLLEIASYVGLDGIQLHGDEDPQFVRSLRRETKLRIIKVARSESELRISNLLEFDSDAILIDGWSAEDYGGSGTRSDWNIARDICEYMPTYIYLAGGLTPANVAEAVRIVKPYAVDVASGVESSPGKKDPEKVAAFIKAAKEAI